jgi:secreted trypsin-like serine protease
MKHCKIFSTLLLATATLSACAPAKPSSVDPSGSASAGIVGGTAVADSDPIAQSTVALYLRSSEGDGVCSGTLVSPNVVLTAAHCAIGLQGGVVVFGKDMNESAETRVIDGVAVHPQFAPKQPGQGGWNDLSLMHFQGTLPAGAKVANLLQDASILKKGLKVIAAGFGTTGADGQAQDEGTLRKTTLSLQNPAYEKTELLFPLNSKGGSTCHGDSGGPAYVTLKGQLTLVGVTSRGTGADCANVSIFTDVVPYVSYIQQTVQSLTAKTAQQPTQTTAQAAVQK